MGENVAAARAGKLRPRNARCRLCDAPGPVQLSHIVPAWMYRRTVRLNASAGTSPVHVGGGVAVLHPKQLTDYLLCPVCEARFKRWEDYLAAVSLQEDDRFPALDAMRVEGVAGEVVSADASALDCDALARLAVSVTWRASVSEMVPEVDLGPFEDSLAQYLLTDGAPLPEHARVMFMVTPPMGPEQRVDRIVSHPYARRVATFRLHGFHTFGAWFATCVGNSLPRWVDTCCITTSRRGFVVSGRERYEALVGMIAESTPKGKLARQDVLQALTAFTRSAHEGNRS
jgi:hypothetical protein